MANNVIQFQIQKLKEQNPAFNAFQDYHNFTFLCLKYFFFNTVDNPFTSDTVIPFLTDGGNDGGIDAIFNDPNSENNDIIVIQSKYYENTDLIQDNVVGELYKIDETLKNLASNKIQGYNDKLITAYRNATSQKEDNGVIKVAFFTSFTPTSKKERSKLEKATSISKVEDVELLFGSDIESQIELCENQKLCIDNDKLKIDRKDNYLEYENSVIVNISALSLQDLQNRRRNGLLGLNLRYFVKQKTVDDGIEKTISKEPENFWYKNNGILIICDDYKFDGIEIKLTNFSIINGGQTTNRIGHIDIENDFYLQCKIVKIKGDTEVDKNIFVSSIAEATNSQKPIKKADIKANSKEQINLQKRFKDIGIYYMTKKGDVPPKGYDEPWKITSLEKLGKLAIATVLELPGTARSNSAKMYDDDFYYPIFQKTNERFLADTLKIAYYYDLYMKKDKTGFDEKTVIPMFANGKTFQLACIAFLSKIKNSVFEYDSVKGAINNTDLLKTILKNMDGEDKIIKKEIDREDDIFFHIFEIIGDEVLGYCFENALDKAESEQKALAPSNYLKTDSTFFKDVIPRIWNRYNRSEDLKFYIDQIL